MYSRPQHWARVTDFLTLPRDSQIVERDQYYVIRSPQRPDFVFGNYIALKDRPEGAMDLYSAIWNKEFELLPKARTMAVQWESYEPSLWDDPTAKLTGCSSEIISDSVLILNACSLHVESPHTIKRLTNDSDWKAVTAMLEEELQEDDDTTADFLQWRIKKWRELVDLQQGEWWCICTESTVLGTAGLFWTEDRALARLQSVVTRTGYRNFGMASQLLSTMIHSVFQKTPSARVITVAASNSPGERLYRKLGFLFLGKQLSFTQRKDGPNL